MSSRARGLSLVWQVVESLWSQVSPIGPDYGAWYGVQCDPAKVVRDSNELEDRPLEQRQHIDFLPSPVIEDESERVVTTDFSFLDAQNHSSAAMLFQGLDRPQGPALLRQFPVFQ